MCIKLIDISARSNPDNKRKTSIFYCLKSCYIKEEDERDAFRRGADAQSDHRYRTCGNFWDKGAGATKAAAKEIVRKDNKETMSDLRRLRNTQDFHLTK